jgi:hypothetical protein
MATPRLSLVFTKAQEQALPPAQKTLMGAILIGTANLQAAAGNTAAAQRLATAAGLLVPSPTAATAGAVSPAAATAAKAPAAAKAGFLSSLTTTEKVVGGVGALGAAFFAWKEWA